jgi:hypothetical protein
VVSTGFCDGVSQVLGVMNGRNSLRDGRPLVVPPGGTADIVMVFGTGRYIGPCRKTADLGTNDPRTPGFTVSVEGTVATSP